MARETIETLNDLIQLDMDAVQAYRQAIEACDRELIRSKLTEFRGDHERHIQDLSRQVTALGGEPKQERDFTGYIVEGFTAIVSHGDHSALLAMRGNEELTNKQYKDALEETLPESARIVVQGNFEDEQRHLAWIKGALDSKLYEETRAA
jgi:uncharacterized protein (TIGR02284 family)